MRGRREGSPFSVTDVFSPGLDGLYPEVQKFVWADYPHISALDVQIVAAQLATAAIEAEKAVKTAAKVEQTVAQIMAEAEEAGANAQAYTEAEDGGVAQAQTDAGNAVEALAAKKQANFRVEVVSCQTTVPIPELTQEQIDAIETIQQRRYRIPAQLNAVAK